MIVIISTGWSSLEINEPRAVWRKIQRRYVNMHQIEFLPSFSARPGPEPLQSSKTGSREQVSNYIKIIFMKSSKISILTPQAFSRLMTWV